MQKAIDNYSFAKNLAMFSQAVVDAESTCRQLHKDRIKFNLDILKSNLDNKVLSLEEDYDNLTPDEFFSKINNLTDLQIQESLLPKGDNTPKLVDYFEATVKKLFALKGDNTLETLLKDIANKLLTLSQSKPSSKLENLAGRVEPGGKILSDEMGLKNSELDKTMSLLLKVIQLVLKQESLLPTPIQQSSVPIQQSSVPIQQSSVPVQQSSVPVQQSSVPIQQSSVPIQQSSVPIQQSSVPIQEDFNPMELFTALLKDNINSPEVCVNKLKTSELRCMATSDLLRGVIDLVLTGRT